MIKKTFFALLQTTLILFLLMLIPGCESDNNPKKISLAPNNDPVQQLSEETPQEATLRIAIGAIISPDETFSLYKKLLDYMSEKSGMKIQLIQRETYEEVNELLRNGMLDMAFVCSGAYVNGHDGFGMEILVAPQAYGETVYYSYIIVHQDSDIKTLGDLRGKKFAFTDPMSNTGKLSPTFLLAEMGETPDTFFSEFKFTQSHDSSIKAVARKFVDGAAVDSLIWEYMMSTGPGFVEQTRIINRSEPYGIPPVVVPKNLAAKKKKILADILLNMHKENEGKAILTKLHIDQFTTVPDSDYDSIRAMNTRINNFIK